MHSIWIVLMLIFPLFLPETKIETLEFDIDRGRKTIGKLIAKKVTRGNKTIYTSSTEASITMVKRITIVYEFKVVMKDGALLQSDTKVFMDKKLHASSRLRLEGDKYHFIKNKKKGYLEAYIDYPVKYPAILLLFDEPANFDTSFSEEEGIFHQLNQVQDQVYEKTNPKGKVNTYHYNDRGLDKATLDAGIFKFKVVRKNFL